MNAFRILLMAAGFGLLAACNTVSGAGEDIESGGRAISDTAEDVQREIAQ